MIYRARTINLGTVNIGEAKHIMVRAAAYLNENYSEVDVEILENIGGSLQQLHMVTRCNSLAALEAYEEKRQGDTEWNAILAEWNAFAVGNTTEDRLYRVVS